MFQINDPGFYRDEDGGQSEILAYRNGSWYGIDANGAACTYDLDGTNDDGGYDIVAKWGEPVPVFVPDPGEGYRLLDPEKDTYQRGDNLSFAGPGYGWIGGRSDLYGLTPAEINAKEPHNDPWIFRRKVFKVSDKGEGIYETRSGIRVPVRKNEDPNTLYPCCPWRADVLLPTGSKHAWWDTGRYESDKEDPLDLVKYIGPIPTWEPTEQLRRVFEYDPPGKDGWRVSHVGPMMRKWVRGDQIEWRNDE